jgi:hypothetical protein
VHRLWDTQEQTAALLNAARDELNFLSAQFGKMKDQLSKESTSLASELNVLRSQLDGIQKQLNSELKAANDRLASVYASRSWRFTAALRWCDILYRPVTARLSKHLAGRYPNIGK